MNGDRPLTGLCFACTAVAWVVAIGIALYPDVLLFLAVETYRMTGPVER